MGAEDSPKKERSLHSPQFYHLGLAGLIDRRAAAQPVLRTE